MTGEKKLKSQVALKTDPKTGSKASANKVTPPTPATETAGGPTSSGTPVANSGSTGGGEKPKDELPPPESPRAREPDQDENEVGPSEVERPKKRQLNTASTLPESVI